ncbi:hypothetical protein ACMYYO_11170 [Dermacoccaceae bacterium W4C1]
MRRRHLALPLATLLAGAVALPAHAAWTSSESAALPAATPTATSGAAGGGAGNGGSGNAGSSSGAGSAAASSAATSSSAAPSSPTETYDPAQPSDPAGPTSATRITPANRFSLNNTNPADTSRWPDARTLFTADELRQVIPGVTAVRASDCERNRVGSATARQFTRCTLNVDITGASVPSTIMVVVRGFGPSPTIGTSWTSTYTQQQERSNQRPGLFTFYRNGALGAAAAYTDGTTTRVLLQRNGTSGEIWFSGIGFTSLAKNYSDSRARYRNVVTPALVQLLATKMTPA